MITREQCVAFGGLALREVAGIGRGFVDPRRVESLLAIYRINIDRGGGAVRDLIVTHLRIASDLGMSERADILFETLRLFLSYHPEARLDGAIEIRGGPAGFTHIATSQGRFTPANGNLLRQHHQRRRLATMGRA